MQLLNSTNCNGPSRRFAPAATVTSDSPLRSDCTAWWTATKLEEHAVSIVMLGPCQSKKYDIRFEIMLREVPVAVYVGMELMSRCS
jgi:hypothetical protein